MRSIRLPEPPMIDETTIAIALSLVAICLSIVAIMK